MSNPDDIVGHKTFDTGEICPETGFPKLRHEPLTRADADALMESFERAKEDRARRIPDEQAAIRVMWDGWYRLKELGWSEAIYCPKDGTHFQAIEPGSTGIHDCNYQGEWPKGSWWVYDGDIWPSRPCLFKLYPEDQAKEDARRDEAAERWRSSQAQNEVNDCAALLAKDPAHYGQFGWTEEPKIEYWWPTKELA